MAVGCKGLDFKGRQLAKYVISSLDFKRRNMAVRCRVWILKEDN